MNEGKKIKKLLRNKENTVTVDLVEFDCWGGERIVGSFKTFALLQAAHARWVQAICEEFGPAWKLVMDDPTIRFDLLIKDASGANLYRRTLWNLDEVRDFLIGGFVGIVK